jgi:hypothetical protein
MSKHGSNYNETQAVRIKTRNQKLFAPIMCSHCGEEIAIGHRYTGGDGHEVHEGCLTSNEVCIKSTGTQ